MSLGVPINIKIITGNPSSPDPSSPDPSCLKYKTGNPIDLVSTHADDISIMKKADTIHDFWNLLRGENVQDILDYMIKQMGESTTMEKHINDDTFKGNVINDIEPKTNSYFEARYNTLPSLCRSKKYGDVEIALQSLVAEYTNINTSTRKTGPIWDNIINNPMINTIRISVPQHAEKKSFFEDPANAPGLNYAAGFIMTFCGKPDENIPVVFPIDATAGQLPKIFRGINSGVYTLATAMTVADSAGGGLDEKADKQKRLIHFNKKYEPFYFPETNEGKYYVNSQYFTAKKLKMYYKWPRDKGVFSSKNQIGILFGVELLPVNPSGNPAGNREVAFGTNLTGSPVSGASVATLRSLMHIIHTNLVITSNIPKAKQDLDNFKQEGGFDKQLDLTEILKFLIDKFSSEPWVIIGFLCDYKRAGDYEQVLSTFFIWEKKGGIHPIFCTGDELCALFARSQGLNCAWSHGIYLDLFRFKTGKADPIAIQIAEFQRQFNALIESLKYFEKVIDSDLYNDYIEGLENLKKNDDSGYYNKYKYINVAIYGLWFRLEKYVDINNFILKETIALIKSINPDFTDLQDAINGYKDSLKQNIDAQKISIATLDDFFKKINCFSQVFSDIKRISEYKNTDNTESIISKNLPGPIINPEVAMTPTNKPEVPTKYIQSELFNYTLEDSNKFYNLKEKIVRYNAAKPRQKTHMEESMKEIIEEYKSTVIRILETFKNDTLTVDDYTKGPNDESVQRKIMDRIIITVNTVHIYSEDKNVKAVPTVSVEKTDNDIRILLRGFEAEIFALSTTPRGGSVSQNGGAEVFILYDDLVKFKYFDSNLQKYFNDELLTLFISMSDDCLNLLESIFSYYIKGYASKYKLFVDIIIASDKSYTEKKYAIARYTTYLKSLRTIKNTPILQILRAFLDNTKTSDISIAIEKKFKTVCTKFNMGLNDIFNTIDIELAKHQREYKLDEREYKLDEREYKLDVRSLPRSVYMLIVILNSDKFKTMSDETMSDETMSDETMSDETMSYPKKRKVTRQDDNYKYLIEYDAEYANEIITLLNKMISTGNNNTTFQLFSHIKTLQLLNNRYELQYLTLLFFAISKKYILKSDYTLKNIYYADHISQASLDYFTLPNESDLLIAQNVNFNDTPCNYFYHFITSIMIPLYWMHNTTRGGKITILTSKNRHKSTRRKLIPKKRHQSRIKKQLPKRKTRKNQLSTQYKRHGKRTSKNGFHHERSE